jgi:hypothetical protein
MASNIKDKAESLFNTAYDNIQRNKSNKNNDLKTLHEKIEQKKETSHSQKHINEIRKSIQNTGL